MKSALLQANHVSMSYAKTSVWGGSTSGPQILHDISLSVIPGRTLGIVGESGSGKSTLCRLLLGLEKPTKGNITFEGQDIHAASRETTRRYRRAVQAILQDPSSSLNPCMTVRSILEEPFRILGEKPRRSWPGETSVLLRQVGLSEAILDRLPEHLSGGQQQRIAIARALALEPQIIVADEPLTALDNSVQAQILNLLLDLKEARNISYVFVSHDLNLVRYLCHDVLVMLRGTIIERGSVESVFAQPAHPYTRNLMRATPIPDPDAAAFSASTAEVIEDLEPAKMMQIGPEHWVLQTSSDERKFA